MSKDDSKCIADEAQVVEAFISFLPPSSTAAASAVGGAMLQRLRDMRTALEGSSWFSKHEAVGSSLLFVYDQAAVRVWGGEAEQGASSAAGANVWMIDFAHTHEAPPSSEPLSHRECSPGSPQGDGYLTGLDHLISVWERVLEDLS